MRMPFALLGARPAGLGAGLHDRARRPGFELGHPAEYSARRATDVAAVLAEADAVDQRRDVMLAEARVRANDAALRAVEARVDARDENACVHHALPRMRFEQLLRMRHRTS